MANGKKNFTEGPIFFRITLFALPIMMTSFLQIFYNMADNIIVGRYSGDPTALAAVGSTGALNSLVINLLIGIAMGTGVVISQFYGAGDERRISGSVHTAMTFSLIGGIGFSLLGLLISRPMLTLLGTKPEVLEGAILYFRIICLGIPANAVYNFGAAIMRGMGNSKVPLLILGSAGLCNVVFNLFFVIVCHMSVEGVAIATVISQYLSAVAIVFLLVIKKDEPYAISFSKLRIERAYLLRILRFGVPAGVQSSMFSIANVLMTSAINTFPTAVVTGNTIASNIDALTLNSMNCFGQATMTFTGQNFGAKKPDRIKKTVIYSIIQTMVVGIFVASMELIFANQLIGLYIDPDVENKAEVVESALTIMTVMLSSYVLFGFLDSTSSALKGLGYTMTSMTISLAFICGVRVLWILAFFPMIGTIVGLYLAYPISWMCALIAAVTAFLIVFRRTKRKFEQDKTLNE